MKNNINSDNSGNGNKDLAHLPFEKYFDGDWRKHFQEKDTVQSILDAAGLSGSHDFVQINSRYLIDDNRIAVIALLRRKNTEVLDKIIIDVIAGNSSFEQFYDVVYNTGSDCDYRMIVCDWNSKNEPSGLRMADNIMCALINLFNHHLFLYWISADSLRDWEGTMKIVYTVIESVAKSDHSSDMPARRDLEYAELRCYTSQASGYFSSQDECYLLFNSYYEDEAAGTEWTDKGIITEVDMGQDDYTWLFAKRTENIKHDDCSYEYDKEKEILTITQDLPFQNFKNSLPEEKSGLADDYYHRARIGSWIDELLGEKADEEKDENPSIVDNLSKQFSLPEAVGPDWKECSHESEPTNLPSVLEFLGPDWKEYFLKPEAIKKIIWSVSNKNEVEDCHKNRSMRKVAEIIDDGMAYDFVEIISATQLGADRQRIISLFRDIRSGLVEKWSLDITSTAPLLDQLFYALYDSNDGCNRKIMLYFKDPIDSNEPDPEIKVEKDVIDDVFRDVFSFTDTIYPIQVITTYSYDVESNFEIFCFCGAYLGVGRQGKIPSRSILESKIWDSYYSSFARSSALREKPLYLNISFHVTPKWTEKGLSMMIYARSACPETNWLITDKKDELARHYPGYEMKVVMEPGTHYCIDIKLHESPVHDFIESSTRTKYNYAMEIHRQGLDLIGHLKEIFQDYVPEAK